MVVRWELAFTREAFDIFPHAEAKVARVSWTSLEKKTDRPLPFADPAGRRLEPTEAIDLVKFDLADWYTIDKPGTYRLRFVFTSSAGPWQPRDVLIAVTPPEPNR